MRKLYTKPTAYVETLTVNTRINGSCGGNAAPMGLGQPLYASAEACAWDVGGETIFGPATLRGCDMVMESYNGVCYSTPNGGLQAFVSG